MLYLLIKLIHWSWRWALFINPVPWHRFQNYLCLEYFAWKILFNHHRNTKFSELLLPGFQTLFILCFSLNNIVVPSFPYRLLSSSPLSSYQFYQLPDHHHNLYPVVYKNSNSIIKVNNSIKCWPSWYVQVYSDSVIGENNFHPSVIIRKPGVQNFINQWARCVANVCKTLNGCKYQWGYQVFYVNTWILPRLYCISHDAVILITCITI
jgi:hypothetical protein